jgi:hypothetical protein
VQVLRVLGVEAGVVGVVDDVPAHDRSGDPMPVDPHPARRGPAERVVRVGHAAVDLAVLHREVLVAPDVVVVRHHGAVEVVDRRVVAAQRRERRARAAQDAVARQLHQPVRAARNRGREEEAGPDLDRLRAGVFERVDGGLDVVELEDAVAVPVAHRGVVRETVAILVEQRVRVDSAGDQRQEREQEREVAEACGSHGSLEVAIILRRCPAPASS